MGYKIKLRNNQTIIVNTKDDIAYLMRSKQISPDTPIFDTGINLELRVSDVVSQNELDMYYSESNNSYSNISSFQNLNTYNPSSQNMHVSRSRKFRLFPLLLIILILFGGTVIIIPRIKQFLENKAQENLAKEFISSRIDNLLSYSKPQKQEFTQKKFGENYKLLQSLNESYAEFYTSYEKYSTYEAKINYKDFENSKDNINKFVPISKDCAKKYMAFVSNVEIAVDKYNISYKKGRLDVNSYIENAKKLKLEYYDLERKFCETIINIRKLLKEKKGTYKKVVVYTFQNEEDTNKYNSLVDQYNSYSQTIIDYEINISCLKEGDLVNIVRKN